MLLIGTNAKSQGLQVKDTISRPNEQLLSVYRRRLREAKIGFPEDFEGKPHELLGKAEEGYTCELLLDGQQRLSSLDLMMSTAAEKCTGDELHYSKRYRFFLNISELGLYDLKWPNLHEITHSDATDFIVEKPYRIGETTAYDFSLIDEELINGFCFNNDVDSLANVRSVLIPLDRIYQFNEGKFESGLSNYDDCFTTNFAFVDTLIKVHRESILRTAYGKRRDKRMDAEEEIPDADRSKLADNLQQWKYRLRDLILDIPKTKVPVIQVSASDFNRISGIFSVINISGVNLDTFDLLVAKTAKRSETIRDEFKRAASDFQNDKSHFTNFLLHNKIKSSLSDDEVDDFFQLSSFIKEKSSIAQDVDTGSKFPSKQNKLYAQIINLLYRVELGLNTEYNVKKSRRWYKTDIDSEISKREAFKRALIRSVLNLGKEWKFGDNEILDIPRDRVWRHARQAAKQMLRAMLFCSTRLGVTNYSALPYKQMLLVLACALTDPIWDSIIREGGPGSWRARKIEKWYWGSIFGGAYQRRQDARVREDIPRLLVYLSSKSCTWKELAEIPAGKDKTYSESIIPGTQSHRFDCVLNAPAYSDDGTMLRNESKALSKTIQAFQLRNGMHDLRDGNGKYRLLHPGISNVSGDSLHGDHLVAIAAWNNRLSEGRQVQRNDSNHPINSPLNITPCSDKSNKYWGKQSDLIKFGILSDNDAHPASFYPDHLITRGTLENKLFDQSALIKGEKKSSDKNLYEKILEPILKNRFENLQSEVSKVMEAAS